MSNHTITKIAVITDDGKTINQHFGRAKHYLVVTIESGQIIQRELREKSGHNQFSVQSQTGERHGELHGIDAGSHLKHVQMAEAMIDCSILLCGGMGRGAYESMKSIEIQPIVTDVMDIDEAISAYLEGRLVNHIEKLH